METVACWNCKTDKAVTTARAKSDFLFNWNSLFAKLENHYKAYKELQVKVEKIPYMQLICAYFYIRMTSVSTYVVQQNMFHY